MLHLLYSHSHSVTKRFLRQGNSQWNYVSKEIDKFFDTRAFTERVGAYVYKQMNACRNYRKVIYMLSELSPPWPLFALEVH